MPHTFNQFLHAFVTMIIPCLGTYSMEALAKPPKIAGPQVSVDHMAKATTNTTNRGIPIEKSGRTHADASLFYPIHSASIGSTIVPMLGYSGETRSMNSSVGEQLSIDSQWTTITPTILLVPDYRPWNLGIFALMSRFGDSSFTRRPLSQFVLGAEQSWNNPSILREYGVDWMRLRGVYRLRQFPGTRTYLTVLYIDARFSNGVFLSAGFPSHFRIGLANRERDDELFFEIVGTSRNFPVEIDETPYWTDGHSLSTGVGYRFPIRGAFYAALRAGVISEELDFINEQGNRPYFLSTDSSLWISAAVETWVEG